MSNRLLLLGVVALAGLGGLLCLLTFLRENANAAALVRHQGDAATQAEANIRRLAELKTALDQTRQELENVSQELAQTRTRLGAAESILSNYRKLPWLSDRGDARPPWSGDIQKLDQELRKLKERLPPIGGPP